MKTYKITLGCKENPEAKTPAANMPSQIAEKIKTRRADLLRKLNIKLMKDYKKKLNSKELAVAIEQIKPDKIA
mgnify:CR=1 FL=1